VRPRTIFIPKEILEHLYLEHELSIHKIAKILNVSNTVVHQRLKEYNIPIRSLSEAISLATKGKPKPWLRDRDHPTQFKRGSIPWNKGLTKEMDPRLRELGEKIAKAYKRRIPWANERFELICKNCGKTFKVKRSRVKLAKYCSPKCAYIAKRGQKQPWAEKRIISVIKALRRRPTKPEEKFIQIIEKYGLPYRYNGFKGEIIIGKRLPDFVSTNGEKKVVEILGRAFHDPNHNSPFPKRPPEMLIEHYKKYEYDCITFWEDELDNEELILRRLLN